MVTKEEKMKMKRERILKEATYLFSKNGYAETTISQVAKAADISFGSIFSYFENKGALFEASVLLPLDELKDLMISYELDTNDLYHSLKEMVVRQTNYFANNEIFVRLLQQVLGQYERFPVLFQALDEFLKEFKQKLEKVILIGQENGILRKKSADAVASSYLAYLNGIRLTFIDPPENLFWHDLALQGFELFSPIHEENV